MTTINIYENKNGEESLILQENITNELKDNKEMLKELKKDNLRLKQLIMELDLKLLKEKEDKGNSTTNKVVETPQKAKTVTGKEINKNKKEKDKKPWLKDEDDFEVLPKTAKKLYKNVELLPTGELEYGSRNSRRKYKLNYDIYDVLYVASVSGNKNFKMLDFKRLHEKNGWERHSLYKLIYNIRENNDLINIINEAQSVLMKPKSFSKENDVLYIDNVDTEIPVHLARDWCNVFMNNNKSRDVYVWELQRKYTHLNKDYVAIIIYNHSNDSLLDVLKKEKNTGFVENNPSRRKNLIMNGGMI